MTITLYLDFDGVFNIPASADTDNADIVPDSPLLERHSSINWNKEVVENFRELLSLGVFQVKWLTTWGDAGNIQEAADLMGLPSQDFFVPDFNHDARGKKEWTEWKAETIIADQSRNPSRYVWIDDDAPTFWEDYVRGHCRMPGLVIKTRSNVGLTNSNLVRIFDWTFPNLARSEKTLV